MASTPQATTESTSTGKDTYPPSRPYLQNFESDVRLGGLSEIKASIKGIQKNAQNLPQNLIETKVLNTKKT